MELFKEAVNGTQMFIFNEKSGIFKTNELVLAKDIEGMFMRFIFEDSLKLVILKAIQIDTQERRQRQ